MPEPDPKIESSSYPMPLSSRVTVLGNHYINLFLVQGDQKTALFEAGISGMVDTVIRQLEHLTAVPDYLIISHPHSDHITGLVGLMDRFPDAEVVTGPGAAEFITHPKAGPLMRAEDEFMSQGLADRGLPPQRPPISKDSGRCFSQAPKNIWTRWHISRPWHRPSCVRDIRGR
jgi:glyoxylase-like metal-dependent hydrolase (beta-lactamase superfamily II)